MGQMVRRAPTRPGWSASPLIPSPKRRWSISTTRWTRWDEENDFATAYTISTAAVPIVNLSHVEITDADGTALNDAVVTVKSFTAGDELLVQGPLPVGIVAGTTVSGGDLILTLTGSPNSIGDFETALNQVMFRNLTSVGAQTPRDVQVTVTDTGGSISNIAHTTITVSPNTAPTADNDSVTRTELGGVINSVGVADSGTATGNVITNSPALTGVDADADTQTPGSLTVVAVGTDVEGSADNGTVGVALAGLYGTLTLNADGSFTYAVNEDLPAVQALRQTPTLPNTLTDTFHYTIREPGLLEDSANLHRHHQGRRGRAARHRQFWQHDRGERTPPALSSRPTTAWIPTTRPRIPLRSARSP